MKFWFQFITTPTVDTPGTSLLLHFDDKRYIFGNVAEGTQRACMERGFRLSHLTDIFLTGKTSWANNGGMIGMVLTLADVMANSATAMAEHEREKAAKREAREEMEAIRKARKQAKKQAQKQAGGTSAGSNETPEETPQSKSPKSDSKPRTRYQSVKPEEEYDASGTLTVHGGKNLAHTFATGRRFIFRKGVPVFVHEFEGEESVKDTGTGSKSPEDPTWYDHHIKVWAMSISPGSSTTASSSSSPSRSPRKRSLNEFHETSSQGSDQYAKDQLLRNAVVKAMFDSDWQMDSLMEVPLAEVAQPTAMFIRSPETHKLEPYTGPKPGDSGSEPLPDIKVLVRKPWPGALIEELPPTTPSHEALSYIVRSHDLRGKFDPKKAAALNVQKGADYGRLANGESVHSKDGKAVTPDMVLGPARTGKGVAIIDLPTVDYVENLVNRQEWTTPEVVKGLEAIIWNLGPGVGSHPVLQEFISNMAKCEHIVSSPDYCPNHLAFDSASAASIRLSKIDNERFQTPKHNNVEIPQRTLSKLPPEPTTLSEGKSALHVAERGLLLGMEPKFTIDKSEVPLPLDIARVGESLQAGLSRQAAKVQQIMKQPEFQRELESLRSSIPGGDAEIIALGTGSSLPSKYRNVSATLLRVPGHGNYLFDCGEGTLGQLKRVFDPDELREILRGLRMIWVSHLHADHHLGTASVIKAWYNEVHDGKPMPHDPEKHIEDILKEKRLFVFSEKQMINWLAEYASVEDYGYSRLVPVSVACYTQREELKSSFRYNYNDIDTSGENGSAAESPQETLTFDTPSYLSRLVRSATGLQNLLAVNVSHCQGAKAVSLVFPNGFKFSYSGDCRPCPAFAEIGKDSTVLLHEATFDHEMQGDAIAKKHSTTTEALQVARMMKAKNVVLTHFSQRYQKLPEVRALGRKKHGEGESGEPPMPVALAFDYMRVKVKDIACAQAYTPALMRLFAVEGIDEPRSGSDSESGGD